jgi:hypothetical protein
LIQITETHRVHQHAGSAIIRARKPRAVAERAADGKRVMVG